MSKLEGGPWATGIGSLPKTENSIGRCHEILKGFRDEIPFLPEIPRDWPDDALVRRPFWGELEPGDMSESRLRVPLDKLSKEDPHPALGFSHGTALVAFHEPKRWIKVQLAGPTTLQNYVSDSTGKALGKTDAGRAAVLARIEMIVEQYAKSLKGNPRYAETTLIVFFDEPGLGSDVSELAKAVDAAKKLGAIVGVHDCGTDFRNAIPAKPDIISFDFASFGAHVGDSWDPLRYFCQQGGSLA